MSTETERRSPLYDLYPDDPPLMSFGGWEMPRDFGGIVREHHAVRQEAGVFDLSHMGRLVARGSDAAGRLQALFSRRLVDREPGRALYGFFCDRSGGCLDDAILYPRGPEAVWMVVNAANRGAILDWLDAEAGDLTVWDRTLETVLLAVQGPDARRALERVDAPELPEARYRTRWEGQTMLAATGYTGEDGGELWLDESDGRKLFGRIVEEGLTLCGLGARDTLRLEKGFPLHGHELGADIDPVTAGLDRFIDWEHAFVGREALEQRREEGPERRLTGLILEGRSSPRRGYPVRTADEARVGEVTSGRFSPTLERGIGLALVEADVPSGEPLEVQVRDRWLTVEQTEPPFV